MPDPSARELSGRVAVVTGASRGIGQAIALELAAAGADVLVHAGHDLDAAKQTARAAEQLGVASLAIVADLADQTSQDRLVDQAWQWRDGVDIWVNNAGVDILTGDRRDWSFEKKLDALWQVDTRATIRLGRGIGRRMVDRGGGTILRTRTQTASAMSTQFGRGVTKYAPEDREVIPGQVLNIGWDGAERGMSGDTAELFAAAKGAVMAFTRSLAQSLAPAVRVNCLALGWIKTAWGEEAPAQWQQRACGESLSGRWGTPEDVARAARFVVSPGADFISGQVIQVNGGFRPYRGK